VTGNIPIVMLWQTKSEQNSKNTFYFLKYWNAITNVLQRYYDGNKEFTNDAVKTPHWFHYKWKSCSRMKWVTQNNQIHSNGMGFADVAAMLYDSAVALRILISYCRLYIICNHFSWYWNFKTYIRLPLSIQHA
jgi:hypothetical protein